MPWNGRGRAAEIVDGMVLRLWRTQGAAQLYLINGSTLFHFLSYRFSFALFR